MRTDRGGKQIKRRIKQGLREPLHHFFPSSSDYDEAFNEFDLVFDLSMISQSLEVYQDDPYSPRPVDIYYHNSDYVDKVLSGGEDWGPLQAGLFDGSMQRVDELKKYLSSDPTEKF